MSWYQEKVTDIVTSANPQIFQPSPPLIHNPIDKNLAFTIPITNIKSESDKNNLISTLQKIEGINGVQISPTNRLTVSYNISKINMETIAFSVAKLGYHYIHRG